MSRHTVLGIEKPFPWLGLGIVAGSALGGVLLAAAAFVTVLEITDGDTLCDYF